MTLQIAEDYFNNNLADETGYDLADGYYSKTIGEDDLNFEFSTDTDGLLNDIKECSYFQTCIVKITFFKYISEIILSYTVSVASTGFAISDTASIRLFKILGDWIQSVSITN